MMKTRIKPTRHSNLQHLSRTKPQSNQRHPAKTKHRSVRKVFPPARTLRAMKSTEQAAKNHHQDVIRQETEQLSLKQPKSTSIQLQYLSILLPRERLPRQQHQISLKKLKGNKPKMRNHKTPMARSLLDEVSLTALSLYFQKAHWSRRFGKNAIDRTLSLLRRGRPGGRAKIHRNDAKFKSD